MENDLKQALEVLKQEGVMLFPADTAWSLGCDATSNLAVEKLLKISKLPGSGEITLLMENPALLDRYVTEVPDIAWDLIEISNTPLTLIFQQVRNIAGALLKDDGAVAVRFTQEPFSRELIRRLRKPVAIVVAKTPGSPEPVSFSEIDHQIISSVDYAVEYNQDKGQHYYPTSIIKLGDAGRIDIIKQ